MKLLPLLVLVFLTGCASRTTTVRGELPGLVSFSHPDGTHYGTGSIIAPGIVLTALHVMTDDWENAEIDLAIQRDPDIGGREITIGKRPRLGETVFFWSIYQGEPLLTFGIVANETLGWYTCDVEGGMSGGVVLDRELRVVDVIVGGFDQVAAGVGHDRFVDWFNEQEALGWQATESGN